MDKIVKNAEGIDRYISITVVSNSINRKVHSLDDIAIKKVISAKLKNLYNFTNGCVLMFL